MGDAVRARSHVERICKVGQNCDSITTGPSPRFSIKTDSFLPHLLLFPRWPEELVKWIVCTWGSQTHPHCPHSQESTLAVRVLLWERRQPPVRDERGLSGRHLWPGLPGHDQQQGPKASSTGSLVHVPARCLLTASDLGKPLSSVQRSNNIFYTHEWK